MATINYIPPVETTVISPPEGFNCLPDFETQTKQA